VGPGTYYEHIDYLGKELWLHSETGWEETILDGSREDGSVVTFSGTVGNRPTIEGFTITGGTTSGIRLKSPAPRIVRNRIMENRAFWEPGGQGGGVGGGDRTTPGALIEGNLFLRNHANIQGGAISLGGNSEPTVIRNNIFEENLSNKDGGAISCVTNGDFVIEQNTLIDNRAGDHGGAVYAGGSVATIRNNLMLSNRADGIGIGDTGSGGAMWLIRCSGTISNNTIVANTAGGEGTCSGGGILVIDSNPDALSIERNILTDNVGSGLACMNATNILATENLFWQNVPEEVGDLCNECPAQTLGNNVVADPRFCSTDVFTLCSDSPAILEDGVIGAYPSGCACQGSPGRSKWP
jgi:predicted outer membrane repeat protein